LGGFKEVTTADISVLTDLVQNTLNNLPWDGSWELCLNQPDYPVAAILNDDHIKSEGGKSIQKQIVLNYNFNQAANRTLYQTDVPAAPQMMNTIIVPWCFTGVNWSYDKNELAMNSGSKAGFIDLIEQKRVDAMIQLAELYETNGWVAPISAADTTTPYGIPYYLPFAANGFVGNGFSGQTVRYQNGTIGTLVAGIDASVQTKWNSFVGTYAKVDNALIRLIRSATRKTNFKFPKMVKNPGEDYSRVDSDEGLYASEAIVTELEDYAYKNGDNMAPARELTGRIGFTEDGVTFSGVPLRYAPTLDTETVVNTAGTTVNPASIYMVRWGAIQPTVLTDMWNVESVSAITPFQHTVISCFLDSTYNLVIRNRRSAGFHLHLAL
jgi:hypothetical protein